MAIPWVAVLKLVPWTGVIRTAPAVLDSARKLWDSAARKSGKALESAAAQGAAAPDMPVEARVARLEATVAGLEEQVIASSALIKELAEQNANLIRRAELNRVLLRRLGLAGLAIGLVAVVALALVLTR